LFLNIKKKKRQLYLQAISRKQNKINLKNKPKLNANSLYGFNGGYFGLTGARAHVEQVTRGLRLTLELSELLGRSEPKIFTPRLGQHDINDKDEKALQRVAHAEEESERDTRRLVQLGYDEQEAEKPRDAHVDEACAHDHCLTFDVRSLAVGALQCYPVRSAKTNTVLSHDDHEQDQVYSDNH
jgi:hypothetical protein